MEVVGGWCCQEKEAVSGWCRGCGCVWDLEVQEVVGGWCRCSCRCWEVAGLRIRGRSSTSQENLRRPCSNSSATHHLQLPRGHAPSFELDSTRVRDATACTLDKSSPCLAGNGRPEREAKKEAPLRTSLSQNGYGTDVM